MQNLEVTVKVMEAGVTTTPTTHQGKHYKERTKYTVNSMALQKRVFNYITHKLII